MRRMLFSPSWYRVSGLKPRLRREAAIHRHVYRGVPWYVIDDRGSGQVHRFSAATWSVAGLLDGSRTVDEVWRAALERLGDDAPTQDEVIAFLGRLHGAGLLTATVSPETEDLFRQRQAMARRGLMRVLAAPFSMKLPLFDPDRALSALMPLARLLYGPFGAALWLAVVGYGLWLAASNADRIAGDISDRVLAPWTLAVMAMAYPALKLLHELGHALAVKRWGGRVREVGVMFVLFVPLPYVDASAATGFAAKGQRLTVGAAGVLVELFLASLALMVWLQVDPGPLHSFAYAVMVLGSLSTLVFNGNPLMRFDGYFILSDLIEIPNLAQRAQAYLGYLSRRAFGIRDAQSPVTAPGEAAWFLIYGLAALIYRAVLGFAIALFVAQSYPVVGGVLALYAVLLMIVIPLGQTLRVLATDAGFVRQRLRVLAVLGLLAVAAAWAVAGVNLPRRAVVQGVTFAGDHTRLRAEADGLLAEFLANPGDMVTQGQPLVLLSDPTAQAEQTALQASQAALSAQYRVVQFENPVEAALVKADLTAIRAELAQSQQRVAQQVLVAPSSGLFLVERPADRLGRYFARGAVIGVIAPPGEVVIATAVPQDQIAAIRGGLVDVMLWPHGHDAQGQPGHVLRMVPGGSHDLADPALGVSGGGAIPLDPRSTDRERTLQTVFRIDVVPDTPPVGAPLIGARYDVRFDLTPETALARTGRYLRGLFLDRFGL